MFDEEPQKRRRREREDDGADGHQTWASARGDTGEDARGGPEGTRAGGAGPVSPATRSHLAQGPRASDDGADPDPRRDDCGRPNADDGEHSQTHAGVLRTPAADVPVLLDIPEDIDRVLLRLVHRFADVEHVPMEVLRVAVAWLLEDAGPDTATHRREVDATIAAYRYLNELRPTGEYELSLPCREDIDEVVAGDEPVQFIWDSADYSIHDIVDWRSISLGRPPSRAVCLLRYFLRHQEELEAPIVARLLSLRDPKTSCVVTEGTVEWLVQHPEWWRPGA